MMTEQIGPEELDKEIAAMDTTPIDMELGKLFDEPIEEYQDRYRQLSENLLILSNQYAKSKEATDKLKAEKDQAEHELISFYRQHQDICPESVTYSGLATFKQKEEVYGDVANPDIDSVYELFKKQGQEDVFFKLAPVKNSFNKFVREKHLEYEEQQNKLKRYKEHINELISQNENGDHTETITEMTASSEKYESELKLDIPSGIRYFKKYSISITNRNRTLGLNQINNKKGENE